MATLPVSVVALLLIYMGVTNHWTEVDWTEVDWTEVDWTGLDWTHKNVRNKLINHQKQN